MNKLPIIYSFDNFKFDAEKLALYHSEDLVSDGDKKTMQVLAALLVNPNKLTSHDEIIEKVWQDNPHGATSARTGQYIKRLRKIFAELEPEKEYITTVKGRGYKFAGNIILENQNDNHREKPDVLNEPEKSAPIESAAAATVAGTVAAPNSPITEIISSQESEEEKFVSESSFSSSGSTFQRLIFVSLIVALPVLTIFAVWTLSPEKNEKDEVRRVVKESQMYESLVLYKDPKAFEENSLDKYWLGDLDVTINTDRNRIRDSVLKLKNDGRRYGDETKCEQFEFQSVEINAESDFAVVKTLEKWFVAIYSDDGTLERNRTIGPYFVSYILRKNGDKWLIEKSTTARVNRPIPRISSIEIISEPKAKQQFFVKIVGQDFEPETVLIEVVGEGCPEAKPCKVPNSALREASRLSDTVLDNVPLTLATGNFKISARNADSQTSNPSYIDVR